MYVRVHLIPCICVCVCACLRALTRFRVRTHRMPRPLLRVVLAGKQSSPYLVKAMKGMQTARTTHSAVLHFFPEYNALVLICTSSTIINKCSALFFFPVQYTRFDMHFSKSCAICTRLEYHALVSIVTRISSTERAPR